MRGSVAASWLQTAGTDASRKNLILRQHRRSRRQARLRALALVAPLCIFLAVMFAWPLATMLTRAVSNDEFGAVLYRTSASLADWDGKETPPEETYANLAADLKQAGEEQKLGQVTSALNFDWTGARPLIMRRRGSSLPSPRMAGRRS